MITLESPGGVHLEHFPAEIDVYRVPHDRMKQLVTLINEKMPEIQVKYFNGRQLYNYLYFCIFLTKFVKFLFDFRKIYT